MQSMRDTAVKDPPGGDNAGRAKQIGAGWKGRERRPRSIRSP